MTYQTPMQGGDCEVEHVDYHVHGRVVRKSGVYEKAVASPSSLVITVSESASVVDCTPDVVRIATPGAELTSKSLDRLSDSFTLDVPNVVVGGQRPSIWVGAVLDTNDNGECDPGELSGSTLLDESELGDIAIALSDEGCPARE